MPDLNLEQERAAFKLVFVSIPAYLKPGTEEYEDEFRFLIWLAAKRSIAQEVAAQESLSAPNCELGRAQAEWAEGERIANVASVDEALTNFSHDPTSDNAVCVVIAALKSAPAKQPDMEALHKAIENMPLPHPRCTYADHSYPAFSAAQVKEVIAYAADLVAASLKGGA
jgi:hypothetical protein